MKICRGRKIKLEAMEILCLPADATRRTKDQGDESYLARFKQMFYFFVLIIRSAQRNHVRKNHANKKANSRNGRHYF